MAEQEKPTAPTASPGPSGVELAETEPGMPLEQDRLELWSRAVRRVAPKELRWLVRKAGSELTGLTLEKLPLPLYELWKLRTLDPFVARASASPQHSTGAHFLILASLPMAESGGRGRASQLASELLMRGHRVTYVHLFPVSRARKVKSTFAHENLTQSRFRDFTARRFALERTAHERLVVLVELPVPEYRASARYLKQQGATVLYDCLDDWGTSQGGTWYSRRSEDGLIADADILLAPTQALADALGARARRPVAVLPEAINRRLFDRTRSYPRPVSLPKVERLYTFAGTAGGESFQWDWVVALAKARPRAAVILLGDNRGQLPAPPANLHFLGLRPYRELPAYLAHTDVCLAPYRADRPPRPTALLKVYEALAMGRPVVAADLPELAGQPGILTARTQEEFVARVALAEQRPQPTAEAEALVRDHSWTARVDALEGLLGLQPPAP